MSEAADGGVTLRAVYESDSTSVRQGWRPEAVKRYQALYASHADLPASSSLLQQFAKVVKAMLLTSLLK